jgi:hypothetical protein
MNMKATSTRQMLGFHDGDRGAHSHATLMIRDLDAIFGATPPFASPADYARVVLDENVLGKRTAAARKHTLHNLVSLYALDTSVPMFRIFRTLWDQEPEGRPLTALLCAVARDPLLRGSVDAMLDAPLGKPVPSSALAATVHREMTASTLQAIGSRMISTWAQAGFVDSVRRRVRIRPNATPGAAAYALALGFMEGGRGSLLLTTSWTRLLECPTDEVRALAQRAARRGWVEYRAAGDVMDLRVDALFTDTERGWCDGQSG